jgi:hypothetical protein
MCPLPLQSQDKKLNHEGGGHLPTPFESAKEKMIKRVGMCPLPSKVKRKIN